MVSLHERTSRAQCSPEQAFVIPQGNRQSYYRVSRASSLLHDVSITADDLASVHNAYIIPLPLKPKIFQTPQPSPFPLRLQLLTTANTGQNVRPATISLRPRRPRPLHRRLLSPFHRNLDHLHHLRNPPPALPRPPHLTPGKRCVGPPFTNMEDRSWLRTPSKARLTGETNKGRGDECAFGETHA